MMVQFTKMTSREFVRKFNKLQDKTCSKLVAEINTADMIYIYHVNGKDLNLFAYSTFYGYWAFVNQEDRVLVTPKTLKFMAKYMKSIYKSYRK